MRALIAADFLKRSLKALLQIFMESGKRPRRVSDPIKFITPAVIYGPGNCCECYVAALCGKPGSSRGSGARRAVTGRRLGGQGGTSRLLLVDAGQGVLTSQWLPPGTVPDPAWAPKAGEAVGKSIMEGSLLLHVHKSPLIPHCIQGTDGNGNRHIWSTPCVWHHVPSGTSSPPPAEFGEAHTTPAAW